MHKHTAYTLH